MKDTLSIKNNKKNSLNRLLLADYVFMVILVIACITVILPFLNVISISMSSDNAVIANPAMLLPKEIQFNAYRALLGGWGIWRSVAMTLIYVVIFVALRLITSLFAGFTLSRRNLPGRKFMLTCLLIPTLFSGGLIPTYLIISFLGLIDSFFVFVIPGCVNCFHILLVKTFIRGLPDSVEEAAYLDGAGYVQLLWHVIAPMSLPVLATIGMLTAIAKWNDWWPGFMYIQDNILLLPLQNVVRSLVVEPDVSMRELDISIANFSHSFKMATITISVFPIMCVYPFVQKYFEQGMNIGSVKD